MPASPTIGQRFGRLVVTGIERTGARRPTYVLLCDCGSEHRSRGDALNNGDTRSCGCLRLEALDVHRADAARAAVRSRMARRQQELEALLTPPKPRRKWAGATVHTMPDDDEVVAVRKESGFGTGRGLPDLFRLQWPPVGTVGVGA